MHKMQSIQEGAIVHHPMQSYTVCMLLWGVTNFYIVVSMKENKMSRNMAQQSDETDECT